MNRKLLLMTSLLFAACNVDHSLGNANLPFDASAPRTDTTTTNTPPVNDAASPPVADSSQPPVTDAPSSPTADASAPSTSAGLALPCEVVGRDPGGARCVAAHSTTRIIVPGYTGPLYQLCKGPWSAGPSSCRGGIQDIMALGGYADVATHEGFCANNDCAITKIYDQSGMGNHLEPAPKGGAKATPDNPAMANDLPVTLNGHKAYGLLIKPGMGYRTGCTGCNIKTGNGMPLGDAPQSVYMVTSQKDLVDGCCFDYGNAETTSNDEGNGAAESVTFGAGVVWGTGFGGKPGPWVMADLENGLYAGWENQQDKDISTNKPLKFDFVTAVLVGDTVDKNNGKGRFALYGADATGNDATFGKLTCMYDGVRPEKTGYAPMQKQGSLVLGTAGDNGSGGGGRFYEGAVIAGPALSGATLAALHDAIVAAGYGAETAITPPDASAPVTGPAQSWTGYIENHQFASGSDRIKLVFTPDASGQVTGAVTFGTGIAPLPATDPNVGYPPGFKYSSSLPVEGPAFTIRNGSLQSNRLRFSINVVDIWAGWCALQPAPTDGSGTCMPAATSQFAINGDDCTLTLTSGESMPFNCEKFELCSMMVVCECSPAGCVARTNDLTTFDVFLADGTGSGSVAGTLGDHNVHFIKD